MALPEAPHGSCSVHTSEQCGPSSSAGVSTTSGNSVSRPHRVRRRRQDQCMSTSGVLSASHSPPYVGSHFHAGGRKAFFKWGQQCALLCVAVLFREICQYIFPEFCSVSDFKTAISKKYLQPSLTPNFGPSRIAPDRDHDQHRPDQVTVNTARSTSILHCSEATNNMARSAPTSPDHNQPTRTWGLLITLNPA